MHALDFALKRSHWSNVGFKTKLLERFDLTPARYDVLEAIQRYEHLEPSQRAIAWKLGVSPVTLCRILRDLEAMQLIVRRRSEEDRRVKITKLTEFGRGAFENVRNVLVRSGIVDKAAARMAGDHPLRPEKVPLILSLLKQLRHALQDSGSLVHHHTPVERALGDRGLGPEMREEFQKAIKVCQKTFNHLGIAAD
jgi:DNA-binding MarR family transcriptional regulator